MKTLSSGEHGFGPVVTRLHALLHAGLDDRVARRARFVARRLRESGPSFLLDEDEGVEGLAGVPGLVEPLGGDEPSGATISRYTPPIPMSVPSLSLRHTQRYLPPTRTSISHTGIDQPGGPNSHCLTSSGLVWASKTSRRGASNTRVITISRSPGVVSFRVPISSPWS